MSKEVLEEVMDMVSVHLGEEDSRWAKVFASLKKTGSKMSSQYLLARSFSVGQLPRAEEPEFAELYVGRLLYRLEYPGETPEEEIIRDNLNSLNYHLARDSISAVERSALEKAKNLFVEIFPEISSST